MSRCAIVCAGAGTGARGGATFEGGVRPPAEVAALLRQVQGSYETALRKITEEQEARRATEANLARVHADLKKAKEENGKSKEDQKKAEATVQKARKARKAAEAESKQLRLRLEKAEGLVQKAEAAKASINQTMQSW
ncbi:hypothetical protein HYH03_003881 [Edaphochlamys debaryana]|uniref:Uncharacterized protein n=1 Tax=Edaphochlamys debaryana TaxID=47281 RepID=A0A835Y8Q6_9CHLO|nr:hypothetical protein HYH03_003881 [Edaphochlamys debaryana]|eukprot:KAG2498123.1 hypothetical protein HYH03_003881 [Edaphochlamys debaryana]